MPENPFAPDLLVEAQGAVRIVTMNRPEALNAVNPELSYALAHIWNHLAQDAEARVVILTGAGRAFSAGGDMIMFTQIQADKEQRARGIEQARVTFSSFIDFPLPVVSAVNGPAVGLGCSLALLADLVYIAESAYLQDPHVSVGLTAGDGGAPFWPLTMSLARVRELLFFGGRITPSDALAWGIANGVTPDGQVLDKAMEVATRLAALPPQAVQSTKRAVNLHVSRGASAILDYALAAEFQSYDTPEHIEAVQRFLKR